MEQRKNWKFYSPIFEFQKDLSVLEAPWGGHNFFAYDLISNIKPKVVVELGTFKGYSLFSFAQAIKDKNLQTIIHPVDTWTGDKHAGFFGDEIYNTFKGIKDKYYKDVNIVIHKMLFDKAVNLFENNSIDILHIDGLHTYEAVKHDFETWLPKVKQKSGIIILHDISEIRDDFGVYKLWDELKKKYKYTLSFNHSHGLGVLFLGAQIFKINSQEFFNYYQNKAEVQYNKEYVRILEKRIKDYQEEIIEYDKNLKIAFNERDTLKREILEYDKNLRIAIQQKEELRTQVESSKNKNVSR